MGLDFLQQYGGRRVRHDFEQPPLESPNGEEAEERQKVVLNFELPPDDWQPRSVSAESIDPATVPQRFIDGCHYGTIVTCLYDSVGHPIPVRLAEIGGVCMRIDGRSLRREFVHIERVVCMIVDPFPWHEVEDFAIALQEKVGMRLLPIRPATKDGSPQLAFDYASMAQWVYTQTQDEMRSLERMAVYYDPETLSLVDGPLMWIEHPQAIGVIKQHRSDYLGSHGKCWQVLYGLKPGQRTPAFQLTSPRPRITWYLKLEGANGELPNWGFVRVEISSEHLERQGKDFGYLDRLSNALLHLRCRQSSYARAPVSMEPIVRAEASLKSLLTPPAILAQRFYHLTGLRGRDFGGFNDE